MKDKNLNILSPWTLDPLPNTIYNWHSSPIVLIWTVNIDIECYYVYIG